jgi:hypothetical protein
VNISFPPYWELEVQGKWAEGAEMASAEISKNPADHFHFNARAQFFLRMGRFEEALNDLEQAYRLSSNKLELTKIGVVYWWLRKPLDAVAVWTHFCRQKDLYTEFPDFRASAALLFFAGVRLRSPEVQQDAEPRLRAIWKSGSAKVWPFPIAGFLLEEMNERTFLNEQTYSNTTLEGRRLCRAHFWVGVRRLLDGKEHEYFDQLKRAIGLEQRTATVSFLAEYWLAKAELGS